MDTNLFDTVTKFCETFPKITDVDDIVYLISLSRIHDVFSGGFSQGAIETYAICLSVNYQKELLYNCFIAIMKLASSVDLSDEIIKTLNNLIDNKIDEVNTKRSTLSSLWKDYKNGELLDQMTSIINSFLNDFEHSMVIDLSSQNSSAPT